jgi:hypothetical protein
MTVPSGSAVAILQLIARRLVHLRWRFMGSKAGMAAVQADEGFLNAAPAAAVLEDLSGGIVARDEVYSSTGPGDGRMAT